MSKSKTGSVSIIK